MKTPTRLPTNALSLIVICACLVACATEDERDGTDEGHGEPIPAGQQDANEAHADGSDHHEHRREHADRIETSIDADMALASGIGTAMLGGGELSRTVKTYGRVTLPSSQISHIRARFPGQVESVSVDIGDDVRAGDLLARIEASASFKSYSITAPISGVVIQRHANPGELAQDQVLFSLANTDALWVELRIFEGQLADVKTSQSLRLSSATQRTVSSIDTIMPSLDEHPFMIARATIDNRSGAWSPGMFVEGDIVVEEISAPLAVDNSAIQTVDGVRGVFVQHGERYEFRPIQLGRSDGRFSEVLGGIEAGAMYVVENSYLIKADVEKSGAAHEH